MFLLKLFIKFLFVCDCLLTMSNYDFDQMYHTSRWKKNVGSLCFGKPCYAETTLCCNITVTKATAVVPTSHQKLSLFFPQHGWILLGYSVVSHLQMTKCSHEIVKMLVGPLTCKEPCPCIFSERHSIAQYQIT